MVFILLLIAMIVERFFTPIAVVRRWGWLQAYYGQVERITANKFTRAVYRYFLVLLTVLIILFVIHHLFFQRGLANLIYCLVILLFCLGPQSQYAKTENTEQDQAPQTSSNNLPVVSDDLHRHAMQALHRIFAPFLWFALLGVFGVVVYRVTEQLPRNNLQQKLLNYFDWIPLRLLTLAFALVSYFMHVFPLWLKTFTQLPADNADILQQMINTSLADDANELHLSALLDRVLIVWLVVLALIVLI